MNIKELYLTDVDNTVDGGFWSQDKINKLNNNFSEVANGLIRGNTGNAGSYGSPGFIGISGLDGYSGVVGINGAQGLTGEGIWQNFLYNDRVVLSPNIPNSCIVSGLSAIGNSIQYLPSYDPLSNNPSVCRIDSAFSNSLLKLSSSDNDTDFVNISYTNAGIKSLNIVGSSVSILSNNIIIKHNNNASITLTDSGTVIHQNINIGSNTAFNGDCILPSGIEGDIIKSSNTNGLLTYENASTSNLFSKFPKGSITQISKKEYEENFNNTSPIPPYTGSQASGGRGFEMSNGRGQNSYTGWYLCNGAAWQSMYIAGMQPDEYHEVPHLNSMQYNISDNIINESSNSDRYTVSSCDVLHINNELLNASDPDLYPAEYTINCTSIDRVVSIGINNLEDSFSGDPGTMLHSVDLTKTSAVYVVFLGVDNLYWYTLDMQPSNIASGIG